MGSLARLGDISEVSRVGFVYHNVFVSQVTLASFTLCNEQRDLELYAGI